MDDTIRQYRMNYIQYKVTGDERYKAAYEAAQNTLDTYLRSQPAPEETGFKQTYETAKRFESIPESSLPTPRSSPVWKYWAIGSLLLVSGGLMALQKSLVQ